jgi:hypothetical protein
LILKINSGRTSPQAQRCEAGVIVAGKPHCDCFEQTVAAAVLACSHPIHHYGFLHEQAT